LHQKRVNQQPKFFAIDYELSLGYPLTCALLSIYPTYENLLPPTIIPANLQRKELSQVVLFPSRKSKLIDQLNPIFGKIHIVPMQSLGTNCDACQNHLKTHEPEIS